MEVWDSCWVFAYGSLLWDPGFSYEEKVPATLHGYSRDMCMYSYEARGSLEVPGLVLGLIEGGHTHGCVYRVKEENKPHVFAYLLQRENTPLPCYFPRSLPVHLHRKGNYHLEKDELVSALCFVTDVAHEQFAKITYEHQVKIISTAFGKRGTSLEYLEKTVIHMKTSGIVDAKLELMLEHATTKFSGPPN
eukprot:Phypoly_transcript_17006.p1 GENE.Phypoly_transcript_17006~~Phypoly_transcript_17006.p1  ORF type:complete len:203 (-),score=31.98 Phypoly_transcript_17006:228-800(-)